MDLLVLDVDQTETIAVSDVALGLVELSSIARGIMLCDVMVKKAAIRLVRSSTVHPGKYVIVFRGGVGEVEESIKVGREHAGDALIDLLFLQYPHAQLEAVLDAPRSAPMESLGVLESYSVASIIRGADAALKRAEINALNIRLADDLGGKGYFTFTGALHDVEAAMDAGVSAIGVGLLAGREVIANPHPDVLKALT